MCGKIHFQYWPYPDEGWRDRPVSKITGRDALKASPKGFPNNCIILISLYKNLFGALLKAIQSLNSAHIMAGL